MHDLLPYDIGCSHWQLEAVNWCWTWTTGSGFDKYAFKQVAWVNWDTAGHTTWLPCQSELRVQEVSRCMYTVYPAVLLWLFCCGYHDDVIKWKHYPRYWPFVRGIHWSPVNFPHKGQWRGALMFSLIYAWTNSWVNNRDAGNLRRHRVHYDVIVMYCCSKQFRVIYFLQGCFAGVGLTSS